MSELILELRAVTRTFPGVKALDNVRFELKPGEIHALMGENGAGQSTLIQMITGVRAPDEGEMYIAGQRVELRGPNDAKRLGIAAIYQHVTCYPDLGVTENIFMGHEKVEKGTRRVLWKEMHAEPADDRSPGHDECVSGIDLYGQRGKWVSAHQMPDSFKAIATGTILGVNTLVFIAIVIYILFYYFLNHTRTGRQIYAVGSNPESGQISGINNGRVLWMV
ncbi:ATP-binding cassette domain-containing protein [Paenibacillus sp. y28]|uniref:ATP-binding cassette domain-containing protein n=1 Tax=Paenibacillus sp. y28 TaxID=3129110 RepID=UPI0030161245